MKVSLSIEIDRPVEALRELFKSKSRARMWMRGNDADINMQGDGTHPGDWIKMSRNIDGAPFQATAVIVEYQWPSIVAYRTEIGGTSALVANRFSETAQGNTLWQLDKVYDFNGPLGFLSPLFRGRFQASDWQAMQQIKQIAENPQTLH